MFKPGQKVKVDKNNVPLLLKIYFNYLNNNNFVTTVGYPDDYTFEQRKTSRLVLKLKDNGHGVFIDGDEKWIRPIVTKSHLPKWW